MTLRLIRPDNRAPKRRLWFFRAFPSAFCPSHSRIGPQPKHKRPHIGCASAHGGARAIERPHIAFYVRDTPIASDEDDLRQARAVESRRRSRRTGQLERRNEDRVFELCAFSRGWVRRACTKSNKTGVRAQSVNNTWAGSLSSLRVGCKGRGP
jgi:hypothetical protein